eukprot:3433971-Rhodomonas_salina.3
MTFVEQVQAEGMCNGDGEIGDWNGVTPDGSCTCKANGQTRGLCRDPGYGAAGNLRPWFGMV